MITGNGSISLRKSELENQKVPAVGFTKLYAAHKASAGATGINLSALTTPPEMSANGFANPTASQLAAANLLFFQNNLTLTSSARGPLQKNLSFVVASSTQLNFIGFTALEGEVFSLTIDYSAQTGVKVVDATATPATGILAAGATDFNIGQSFQVNKYGTTQAGACLVYVDGAIQYRNTGNSSVTKDGNYYEVDNGSGSFSVIRFNNADPDNSKNVLVTPNGLLSERPDGSMMAVIETLQGQVNSAAAYLAALAGLSQTTILGSAPSNVDLKAFGDRVLTLEQNRARIDQSNTWTAAQPLVGYTDGSLASAGQVGEYQIQSRVSSAAISLTSNTPANATATPLFLTPGTWYIGAIGSFDTTGTTSITALRVAISSSAGAGSATFPGGDTVAVPDSFGQIRAIYATVAQVPGNFNNTISIPSYRIVITATTTFYLVLQGTFTASTLTGYGSIFAQRAVR